MVPAEVDTLGCWVCARTPWPSASREAVAAVPRRKAARLNPPPDFPAMEMTRRFMTHYLVRRPARAIKKRRLRWNRRPFYP
jgi:hypothetical protein